MQFSVSDFLVDIAQNSIEADSSVITIDLIEEENLLTVCVGDNGKGMDEETLKKVKDPYYTDGSKHENRKVGLGIPFLIQAVNNSSGAFDIQSDVELGTSLYFTFDMKNIDCPPMGDLTSAFRSIMLFSGQYELLITHSKYGSKYSVSKSELVEALGELESSDSLVLAKKYLDSLEEELNHKGGK